MGSSKKRYRRRKRDMKKLQDERQVLCDRLNTHVTLDFMQLDTKTLFDIRNFTSAVMMSSISQEDRNAQVDTLVECIDTVVFTVVDNSLMDIEAQLNSFAMRLNTYVDILKCVYTMWSLYTNEMEATGMTQKVMSKIKEAKARAQTAKIRESNVRLAKVRAQTAKIRESNIRLAKARGRR